MKSVKNLIVTLWPGLAMAVLILDAKTALTGAQSGLKLCVQVVVPSLLPFLFLSVMVTGSLLGQSIPFLRPLGKICRIPTGAEGLLSVGLIGGYPVGAQSIAQAYRDGALSKADAHRMLGFCSNAGPSFIFGILGAAFSDSTVLWALWGIHILSALLTGVILPGGSGSVFASRTVLRPAPSKALERSLKVMASICGWVILFRVLLAFMQRWFLWMLPNEAGILISGILELTNGCCRLQLAEIPGLRFLFASLLLSFGGICVGLQTISVTEGLGTGLYFPGKAVQTLISAMLAIPVQYILFPADESFTPDPMIYAALTVPTICCLALKIIKNHSSNLARQGV